MKGFASGRSQAMYLSGARLVDQLCQLLAPVFLIRLVTQETFAEYRLFWLIVNTVFLLAPLGIPLSLLYFLPRASRSEKRRYVAQSFLFMLGMGALSALVLCLGHEALPESTSRFLGARRGEVALFLTAWLASAVMDYLPTAENRLIFQANYLVAMTAFRTGILLAAAAWGGDLRSIMLAMLVAALARLVFCLGYATRVHGWLVPARPWLGRMIEQLRYAAPFGIGSSLYQLRKMSEQWIAAWLFSALSFSGFSLAAMALLPFDIVRSSVSASILPRMSALHQANALDRLLDLNRTGNVAVCALCFPAAAFAFVFTDSVVQLLFTEKYLFISPVIRVYLLQAIMDVEVSTLMFVFGQGRFTMAYNVLTLGLTVTLSAACAISFGLPGVAAGSAVAKLAGTSLMYARASRLLSRPVSALQDWKTVGGVLAASLSACVPPLVVHGGAARLSLPELALWSVVFGLTYLVGLWTFGQSRIVEQVFRRNADGTSARDAACPASGKSV